MLQHYLQQVALFGYLRINACLQLPEAFRSLPRPSSAPGAKAFAVCSYLLDLLRCYLAVHFSRYKKMVEMSGIEPLASCVQGRRSPS